MPNQESEQKVSVFHLPRQSTQRNRDIKSPTTQQAIKNLGFNLNELILKYEHFKDNKSYRKLGEFKKELEDIDEIGDLIVQLRYKNF